MNKTKKLYECPDCRIITTSPEFALLQSSSQKTAPKHNSKGKLSKTDVFSNSDFSGVREWNV